MTAAIVLNLIAGNEINLTSKNITIKSDNFNVDENGNITCNNATMNNSNIVGGNLKMWGSDALDGVRVFRDASQNTKYMAYMVSDCIGVNKGDDSASMLPTSISIGLSTMFKDKILSPAVLINGEGFAMYGMNQHKYRCNWTGSQLQFWVDETNVGTLSDKRLKTDIKEIDDDFIKAIKEIEMKQFKIANRNGLVSFGILAQDLIEIFEKYNKNPFDYEIVQETQYRTDDDTIYYTINYEQFLILKAKAQEQEIKELQEKDKQKDEVIQDLLKRVQALEKGAKNE